ncbi:hypothetical protein QMK17_21855 [Rhodococcus sp. G-MC3]|uniref:hypothetical protein n=1 Tax=Rhodococcus sp. G-MC3 TaxID=3046209 RepID=UPI0024B8BE98|nr:hypothetical protein [Rhodococcus sp. G-MC3]MDJ0395969.1 hypothetical protein [Rhodococcus sp. G-MC3]
MSSLLVIFGRPLQLAGELGTALSVLLRHIDSSRDRVVARAEQAASLAGAVRP